VKRPQSALAGILLTAAASVPCTAQDGPIAPAAPSGEACAQCFAYLEFPPEAATAPQQPVLPQSGSRPPTNEASPTRNRAVQNYRIIASQRTWPSRSTD
jgi:hypothetical protein